MLEKQPLLPVPKNGKYVLVIHGGAGTMSKNSATPEQIANYHNALRTALLAGYEVLTNGGEAMDAVVAAVTVMEDNVLFNAGKGAVFNVAGKNELEASIMLSRPPFSHPDVPTSRRGIGLTLLTKVKNPSQAARALYLSPAAAPHTFLSGENAQGVAALEGIELVDPSYFFTENRWREHRRGLGLPEEPLPDNRHSIQEPLPSVDMNPTGTVGAVALDVRGCIAALTSTGGRTNKLVGRIGDTPLMAAGFWAEEWSIRGKLKRAWRKCLGKPTKNAIGISGTGDGDYFIRQSTAATIARRVQLLGESADKAARFAVEALRKDGGIGGVIVLDGSGNVSMPLNCPGMYRGVIREDGKPQTAIFADDILQVT